MRDGTCATALMNLLMWCAACLLPLRCAAQIDFAAWWKKQSVCELVLSAAYHDHAWGVWERSNSFLEAVLMCNIGSYVYATETTAYM